MSKGEYSQRAKATLPVGRVGNRESGTQLAASSSFWGQAEAPTGELWCFEKEPGKPGLVRTVDRAWEGVPKERGPNAAFLT